MLQSYNQKTVMVEVLENSWISLTMKTGDLSTHMCDCQYHREFWLESTTERLTSRQGEHKKKYWRHDGESTALRLTSRQGEHRTQTDVTTARSRMYLSAQPAVSPTTHGLDRSCSDKSNAVTSQNNNNNNMLDFATLTGRNISATLTSKNDFVS